jgi:epidermal growth factor receptor substrate 15
VLPSRKPFPVAQSPAIPPLPLVAAHSAVQWDVTPAEKAASGGFFDMLDTHKRGYIDGAVAGPFMVHLKLPNDKLAQVW